MDSVDMATDSSDLINSLKPLDLQGYWWEITGRDEWDFLKTVADRWIQIHFTVYIKMRIKAVKLLVYCSDQMYFYICISSLIKMRS